MNINELFEQLQNLDNISGEFTLKGNCIIWSYNILKDSEEIASPKSSDYNEDDDEFQDLSFYYEAISPEELLLETYDNDIDIINGVLDEFDETDNWEKSEYDIVENEITFKIY